MNELDHSGIYKAVTAPLRLGVKVIGGTLGLGGKVIAYVARKALGTKSDGGTSLKFALDEARSRTEKNQQYVSGGPSRGDRLWKKYGLGAHLAPNKRQAMIQRANAYAMSRQRNYEG